MYLGPPIFAKRLVRETKVQPLRASSKSRSSKYLIASTRKFSDVTLMRPGSLSVRREGDPLEVGVFHLGQNTAWDAFVFVLEAE